MWRYVRNSDRSYMVSRSGEVKSIERRVRAKRGFLRLVKGKKMKIHIGNRGYPMVRLRIDGKSVLFLVHRLVAEAFIPNPENKPEVNHKNGIKTDNRVENLEWATPSEQRFHAYETGLQKGAIGSKNAKAVLTEELVTIIRKRIAEGERQQDISDDLGISYSSVSALKRGLTWRHIPCPPEQDRSNVSSTARGVNNGSSKLKPEDIPIIRQQRASGLSRNQVAKNFNVWPATIRSIETGRTWSHIV